MQAFTFSRNHGKPSLFPGTVPSLLFFPKNTPSLAFFPGPRQAFPFSRNHAKPCFFPKNTPSLAFFPRTRQALLFSQNHLVFYFLFLWVWSSCLREATVVISAQYVVGLGRSTARPGQYKDRGAPFATNPFFHVQASTNFPFL